MTPEWIGLAVGLVLGIVSYIIILALASKVERDENNSAESMRVAALLRAVASFDVILFTVIGYFVGPMLLT